MSGGGRADGDNDYIVMTYNISAGKWATLPPYSTRYFAMTIIDSHLILVGGVRRDIYRSNSKRLGVWSEDSRKWTHPYPDMTTPRSSCSAFTYKSWLVVAGGWGTGDYEYLSPVEVMNTDTKQWYAGPPTPIAWIKIETAIVGDTCYFMNGWIESTGHTVYSVSLPALVPQLNSGSSAKDTQTWKELPQPPVKYAALLSISGSLLAVGGRDESDEVVSALHLYQPDAGQWVKVADMPTPRYCCTSIMITDKELLVAGGSHDNRLATTYTALIC